MTGNLILTVLTAFSLAFHPLHVSICEIDHDTERNALEITTRIFVDDLEAEIRVEKNDPQLNILEKITVKERDRLIEEYLRRHVSVWLEGKLQEYTYLGSEEEAGAMFCYMEITGVSTLGKVGVKNDILLNHFDDQVNLIHISQGDKVRSMKLEGRFVQDEIIF